MHMIPVIQAKKVELEEVRKVEGRMEVGEPRSFAG